MVVRNGILRQVGLTQLEENMSPWAAVNPPPGFPIEIPIMLGIALALITACTAAGPTDPSALATTGASTATPLPTASPGPTPTLTEEQLITAPIRAYFKSNFFSSRADCVQAVDDGTKKGCVYVTDIEPVTRSEWEQLFPDTVFYLVDVGGWRSSEGLLAHESQNRGLSRHLVARQKGQAYHSETFDRLLEANGITITDTNRELVARSFALMSIPDYLGGDVRFLEWGDVEPGTYQYNYSHHLKAWTEVWGCEVSWWFVFAGEQMRVVSRTGGPCQVSNHGDYIADDRYFRRDSEASLLGVPPYSKEYSFR